MRLPGHILSCIALAAVLSAFSTGSKSSAFEKNFTPWFSSDTTAAQKIVDEMKKKLDADLTSVKDNDKHIVNDVKDTYSQRFDNLKGMLKEGDILLDQVIAPYVNEIFNEILTSNPALDKNIRLLICRSNVPNAFTFGEGTIVFNLGLLSRFENDAQVASTLCHELAHHNKNHVNNTIWKTARLLNSKETTQQVKQATRGEYGTYTKLKKVIDDMMFGFMHHSRAQELEADSLGLIYLMNTRFDATAAIREMAVLDSADLAKYRQLIDLKKYFDSKQYPFKNAWNEYTKSSMWHASFEDMENADSLKTHPDCKLRGKAYERQLSAKHYSSQGKLKFIKSQQAFNDLIERTDFELVESEYLCKEIDKALYHALLMLDRYPDNIYLQAIVGKCFYQMYNYQKNRELGKVVALPDPRFDENFDRLLTFIEQLRLTDYTNIGFYYLNNKSGASLEDENFLCAYYLCSKAMNNAEEMSMAKKKYLSLFSKGRFKKDFETNEK